MKYSTATILDDALLPEFKAGDVLSLCTQPPIAGQVCGLVVGSDESDSILIVRYAGADEKTVQIQSLNGQSRVRYPIGSVKIHPVSELRRVFIEASQPPAQPAPQPQAQKTIGVTARLRALRKRLATGLALFLAS